MASPPSSPPQVAQGSASSATTPSNRNLLSNFELPTIICNGAVILGNVTYGPGNVFHPQCVIDGRLAPITIGKGNVFEEMCHIVSREATPLAIGSGNYFSVHSKVDGVKSIGNWNIVSIKGRLVNVERLPSDCFVGIDVDLARLPPCQVAPSTSFFSISPPDSGTSDTDDRTQVRTVKLHPDITTVNRRENAARVTYLQTVLPRSHRLNHPVAQSPPVKAPEPAAGGPPGSSSPRSPPAQQ
ncbi:hypothetical protein H696_05000 [Fonticula alba]|uniref:Dynactin subunit 6 n=1 Tax=Fonticula alba TaxID=691883 RepID=A0A058Z5A9_FONAL|nr:hypothetical protein H696_05000 [Fonticula alba]KCV68712.1 hypothetical protein H696_05000 [Fonticula alba]|eukprot:XP_009497144.1 hypothetical protein H696_05000 [Fonticula alba]